MPNPIIVADYREKRPFTFGGSVAVEQATLAVGDYSIRGLERLVAVERKSLDDLTACMGRDRERFVDELRRARGLRCFCVVVEGAFSDLTAGHYYSHIEPGAAVASVMAWQSAFRVPFFFAGGRAEAETATLGYLLQSLKVIIRMKQASLI